MQAHFLALQGVASCFETVELVSQAVNPRLNHGRHPVHARHEFTHTREVVADLDSFFEAAVRRTRPGATHGVRPPVRRNIKLAEGPASGKRSLSMPHRHRAGLRQAGDVLLREWDAMLVKRTGARSPRRRSTALPPNRPRGWLGQAKVGT